MNDEFPDDTSACFAYARVMVEFVSCFLLQEEGTTEESVEAAMNKG